MRLSHVSVSRGNGNEAGMDYCIRAELEDQVPPALGRLFQLTWLITPALRKLSTEVACSPNDITVCVKDAAMIEETLEAMKDTLKKVNDQPAENPFPGVSSLKGEAI